MVRAERFSTLKALFLGCVVLRTSVLISSCVLISSSTRVFFSIVLLKIWGKSATTSPGLDVPHWFLFCRHWRGGSDWIQIHSFAVFDALIASYCILVCFLWVLVSVNMSSAIVSLSMCAVNISRAHSSSWSPQSEREASPTRSAWKFSSVSFFLCLRHIKLYLLIAMILCVIKMSSNTFVGLVFAMPCLDIGIGFLASASSQITELHMTPLSLAFRLLFSQSTSFSWFLTSLFLRCASVSPCILTSKMVQLAE